MNASVTASRLLIVYQRDVVGRVVGGVMVNTKVTVDDPLAQAGTADDVDRGIGVAGSTGPKTDTPGWADDAWRARMSAVLDCLPHAAWINDAEGRYQFQNRHDRASFGDLIGKRADEINVSAATENNWQAAHDRVLKGETVDYESTHETPHGRRVTRTTLSPLIINGEIVGLIGMAVDRTKEASVERELRENRALLEDYLATSSDWVWQTDTEHRFTVANATVQFGTGPIVGTTRWDLLGIDLARDPHFAAHKADMDAQRPIRHFIYRATDAQGVEHHVEVNGKPFFDTEGRFAGYRGTSRDVTDRELMIQRLQRSELLVRMTHNGIMWCDADWRIEWINPAFEKLTGYTLEEIAGRRPGEFLPSERMDPVMAQTMRDTLNAGQRFRGDILSRKKDGSDYWAALDIQPLRDEQGKVSAYISIRSDVSELHAIRRRMAATLENVPAGIIVHDDTGTIVDANLEAEKLTGLTREQLVGRSPFSPAWRSYRLDGTLFKPEEHPAVRALGSPNAIRDVVIGFDHFITHERRFIRGNARAIDLGPQGGRIVVHSFVDITMDIRHQAERQRAEEALMAENAQRRAAQELLRDVIDTIPDAIAAFDREDRLALYNECYPKTYSESAPAIFPGARFEDIIRYGLENGQYPEAGTTPAEREAWFASRMEVHHASGAGMIQQLPGGRWIQVRECRSTTGYTVGVRTDITALKRAEAAIKKHAEQDPLTGLMNRSVLFTKLEQVLNVGSGGASGLGCLVLFDMDHFKDVNDTLGHDAGDQLLRTVADRLRGVARAGDVIARLGGDEFAAMFAGVGDEVSCIGLIQYLQAELERPVIIDGRTLKPSFSIGVTLFPRDGRDPTRLFKNADIALYEAKAQGRDRWCFFDPSQKEQLERRQTITADLRVTISRDELEVALQPQVDFATGGHSGFEALVRWTRNGRQVAPGEFIPIAEETGLIVPLGSAVLRKSCAAMRHMLDQGLSPRQVAVNVAALQLKSPHFVEEVADVLNRHGLEPAMLELEVTETVLLDRSADRIETTLNGLHRLGVTLALDDFGTGYASLSHLKRFPVDRLKIDQSFVRDIGTDPDDAVIVRAIINLAHSLGMDVVAEGIETEAQFEYLRLNGCDVAQGYLFSKPLVVAEAARYLEAKTLKDAATLPVAALRGLLETAYEATTPRRRKISVGGPKRKR